MKSETLKLALLAFILLPAQASFGFGHYSVWKGGSGNWSDADMWDRAPEAGDYIVFSNDSPAVVMIDADTVQFASFDLAPAAPGEVGQPVTLRGTGAAWQGASYLTDFVIGAGRTLIIDGPELAAVHSMVVDTNAVLRITGGSFLNRVDGEFGLILKPGASVVVDGGELSVCKIFNADAAGSRLALAAGTVRVRTRGAFTTFDTSLTDFLFTGGTLFVNESITSDESYLLPPKGARLENLYSYGTVQGSLTEAGGVYVLGGALVATNRSDGTFELKTGTNQSLIGGGELYVPTLTYGSSITADADLSKICLSQNFGATAYSGKFNFCGGVTFGCWGDVSVNGAKMSPFYVYGPLTVDTLDCFDGETHRSFSLENQWFYLTGMTAFTGRGGGTIAIRTKDNSGLGYLSDFALAADTTLYLTNASEKIVADTLTLGARSVLAVGANRVSVAASQTVDPAATIRYGLKSLAAGSRYILWEGPFGTTPPVNCFAFDPALPSGWFITNVNNVAWVSDGTVQYDSVWETKDYYWLGADGGNMNVTANWGKNKILSGKKFAYMDGDRQLAVTNDLSSLGEIYGLSFLAGAGPYVISGERIPFFNGSYKLQSINSASPFPQRLETQVAKTTTSNPVAIYTPGGSYIEAVGGGELPDSYFFFQGDIRVGGTWRVATLAPQKPANTSRATRLSVLSGGTLNVLDQRWEGTDATTVSNQAFACVYDVHAGATMEVGGSLWRWSAFENTHYVNGAVKATCPVQMAMAQTFCGTGSLDFACVRSDTSSACRMNLAGSVTIRPQEWLTVRSGADNPMRLAVRDTVTIGAKADWMYGPADGFSSASAPADRALLVEGGARTTVAFDTQDPDNASVGHVITLADPLVQTKYSMVVKRGKGELRLPDSGNELSNFEIRDGALVLGAAQSFDKLTFSGGALKLSGALAAAASSGRVAILTATAIDGEVSIAGSYSVRTVEGDAGVTVFAKKRGGLTILVR